jgi:hypothetical protein
MRSNRPSAYWLYLVNTALLATHEIDSAYWHEWTLFHLPGGIQFFLLLNLALLIVVLYGFDKVARQANGMRVFSYILAGGGIFAFSVHTFLMLLGHPEFRSTVSIGLLIAILLVSIAQVVVLRRRSTT